MTDRSVVVTGMGAVTPLGPDVCSTWAGLLAGRSGVRTIESFDASGFATTFAGQIDTLPELAGTWAEQRARWSAVDQWDRKTELLLGAAQEAWKQAGGDDRGASSLARPDRIALCLGSEGGRKLLEEVAERTLAFRHEATLEPVVPHLPIGEMARMRPGHPTRVLASTLGIAGPVRTVCTACTSAAGAIAEALWLVRMGAADVAVCGGTDTLVEAFMVSGFSLLGALSTRNDDPAAASRPFDFERDGFVLSEGSGVLVIEAEDHARARGAPILGRLLGAGLSNNAYRVTDSPPDGRGPLVCMTSAMKDAKIQPPDVGYVNAHGTSTPMNDASETRGIRRALGAAADSVTVTSTKSMIGHLVAACGGVEAVVSLCTLRDGVVHATRNLTHPDPDCDLDYVPDGPRTIDGGLSIALSNSFGFGGCNATLAFGAEGWR
ncbi:MAG: beta-ketoacyl-[acyl-carrier-protein] synthase family protein [Proteobacteria bacterium]|nr:beta-ketoacyl-[acyl-carrier-protein] synthase family protein [Pseudomonadota bacterium]